MAATKLCAIARTLQKSCNGGIATTISSVLARDAAAADCRSVLQQLYAPAVAAGVSWQHLGSLLQLLLLLPLLLPAWVLQRLRQAPDADVCDCICYGKGAENAGGRSPPPFPSAAGRGIGQYFGGHWVVLP